ncbi:MAG TPA: glutathione peroxidase [Bacteroidales bacterium]|nr:glutathione peroxidase [Bacteroidales bacterium]
MTTFYDFEANNIKGETISMKDYEGKTVIVVNTARKCGFTPQYEGLEKLYQQYKDQGLVILGFPCNQFANQEPGSSDEIEEFCEINYGVTFPLFEKINVNGKETHPIFKFLKSQLSGGIFGSSIKWNFTKFVIDSQGIPVKRFSPNTKPENMENTINELLKQ